MKIVIPLILYISTSIISVFADQTKLIENNFEIFANTNKNNVILYKSELIDIFLGNKIFWKDGNPITVVLYNKDDKQQLDFIRDTLGISAKQYFRIVGKNENHTFYNEEASVLNMVNILINVPDSIGLLQGELYKYDKIDNAILKIKIKDF